MNQAQNYEVTAFYEDRVQAQAAMQRLRDAKLNASNIRLVEGNDPSVGAGTRPEEDRGFLDALADIFMPAEDRHTYAEGLYRGGYVVSALVPGGEHERAIELLDDEHGIDLDERSAAWRSEGWSGYNAEQNKNAATHTDGDTIEVAEESLKIGKRDVSNGRVKVRSYVVEDQVSEDVNLKSESVDINRRAVDRKVDNADAAFKERTVEVEETAQEAVVSKEARVVEEIDVSRQTKKDTETVTGTVRRTEVEIDDERH